MTGTQIGDQQLGEALGRIHRKAGPIFRVTTDGCDYNPTTVAETLAADLGFDRPRRDMSNRTPTPEELHPAFVRDPKGADWRHRYNHRIALRILTKAGADPADVSLVRDALGLTAEVELDWDALDEQNEQVRLHWAQIGAMHFAHAVANAQENGRRQVLANLQVIADSGLLGRRGGDTWALSEEITQQAETVKKRDVTPLDQLMISAKDGQKLTVAGLIGDVRKQEATHGSAWATAHVYDGASVEILVLPKVYERVSRFVVNGTRVEATGKFDSWGGLPRLIVEDLTAVDAPEPALS